MQRGKSQRGNAIHTSIPRLSYNPRSKLCYSNFTFSLQKRIVGKFPMMLKTFFYECKAIQYLIKIGFEPTKNVNHWSHSLNRWAYNRYVCKVFVTLSLTKAGVYFWVGFYHDITWHLFWFFPWLTKVKWFGLNLTKSSLKSYTLLTV